MSDDLIEQALIEFAQKIDSSSNQFADVDLNEFILNFEDVDQNFDQLMLIQTLKHQLAEDFAAELLQCKDQQTTTKLMKSIKKSPKFVKWKQRMTDMLINKASSLSVNMQPNTFRPRVVSDFNASDIMNSLGSWMGSSSPYGQSTLFVGKNVLKRTLNVLELESSDEDILASKIDALHEISTMRSSDLALSEQWSTLQNVLMNSLDDQTLYLEVLRFLTKLFNSQTHTIVVDVFLILVHNLERSCLNNYHTYQLNSVMNVENPLIVLYLTKFRLFHALISSFPLFWIRYSDELVSNVIEKTVKFLSVCNETRESSINPILSLALFDPDAKWLVSWMFTTFSSVRVINAMKADDRIFTFLLSNLFEKLTDAQSNGEKNSKHSLWTLPTSYEPDQLRSLLWSQCCRMVSIFTYCVQAQTSLFPAKFQERTLNCNEFFAKFINVWLSDSVKSVSDVKYITTFITKLSAHVKNHQLFCQSEVLLSFVQALSASETISHEIKTSILHVFNDIFIVPTTFRKLSKFEVFVKTGETTTLLIFLVVYCSKIVNLAWQKDPDAPLNSVYAAVKFCQTICRYYEGRSAVFSNSTVLQDTVRLAKDKTLSVEMIFPLLTACERRSDVRKFLYNSMNFSPRSVFIWATPLDYPCGNLVQKFAEYVRIVAKSASAGADVPFGLCRNKMDDGRVVEEFSNGSITVVNEETLSIYSTLFIWLSNPMALRELLRNETFINILDASFVIQPKLDEAGSNFVLGLIRMALCNLQFILPLRQRIENGRKIQFVLERQYFTDDKQLEMTPHSLLLLDIFIRQKGIAGPNEKLQVNGSSPINIDSFFDSNCFRAEPSCFIAKPSSASSLEIENNDYLNTLLQSIESKQRISHSDLLWQYVSTNFRPSSNRDSSSNRVDSSHRLMEFGWNLILEYGENLKLFDDVRKATIELKNVLRYLDSVRAEGGAEKRVSEDIDWFVGVIFLMTNGRSSKTIQFLNAFLTNVFTVGPLWPCFVKNYNEIILHTVIPVVEKICEQECSPILECLNRSGISLSSLLLLWYNQCFLNFLDYPEIVNFVALSILGGPLYQALFCCCVLKHLSNASAVELHSQNLANFLADGYNFRMYNYVKLLRRFSEIVKSIQ